MDVTSMLSLPSPAMRQRSPRRKLNKPLLVKPEAEEEEEEEDVAPEEDPLPEDVEDSAAEDSVPEVERLVLLLAKSPKALPPKEVLPELVAQDPQELARPPSPMLGRRSPLLFLLA